MNLNKIFFLLVVSFLFNCSTSTDDNTNQPPDNTPQYISISADKTVFEVGETVTFSVSDDEDDDITAESTILVEGTSITGNTYSPTNPGDYEVEATYQTVSSNIIYIRANPPVTLSSIEILPSEPALFIGNSITFSASAIYSDNSSIDITSDAEFYVNDVLISGNEYTGNEEGAINVEAVYESTTSSSVQVQIVDPSNLPASFSKKAVIEDYTGAWCGWCPRVSYAAGLVEEQTDKVFVVGVHNGDVMANSFGSQLENAFNVTGWPTAYVDRSATWQYPEPSNINQPINAAEGTTSVGLAIESTLTGSTLNMTISTGFLENISEAKLVVFVLEDGIIQAQQNYTSYYGGVSTISDFEHNGVLRYAATDVMGNGTTSILGIHNQTFSVDLSSYGIQNPTNTGILAMLVTSDGRLLLNAQYAPVNQTQDFD